MGTFRRGRSVGRRIFGRYTDVALYLFLNLPFGLVSFFMLILLYKEKLAVKEKRHIDYPGALIFSVGTIALLYALLTGSQNQSWTSPVTISLIVFALVTYLVFVSVEKKSPEPLIPLSLFTNRNVTMINLLTLLTNGIVISMVVYLPIWSQGSWAKARRWQALS